jgi:Capsule polysaccharide biosynthesis protein
VRFLFANLQFRESDFYGRVGSALTRFGHDVAHVSFSRRAAKRLQRRGERSYCLPELMDELGSDLDYGAETARIERTYEIPSVRDVYRTDPPCIGRDERWCVARTVRHFLALELIFDEVRPELVVPEVGNETMRTAAHAIGLRREARVLFLIPSIFPRPLRVCENTIDAPIVPREGLRELEPHERAEVERFIARFACGDGPVCGYRTGKITRSRLRDFARDVVFRALWERDNDDLRPLANLDSYVKERGRVAASKPLYEPVDRRARPFVYFPLHASGDYKIRRMLPHCVDQASIIEQVADALPQGYDLVLKEHPLSIGRSPVGLLRRLAKRGNTRLVEPRTGSRELIERARAVVVISSTVGLEALLRVKPVLTLGRPFYSGYGFTLDLESFREIRSKVPAVLDFRPDREQILSFLYAAMRSCFPGAPVGNDDSDANAAVLAGSLDAAARRPGTRSATTAARVASLAVEPGDGPRAHAA